MTVICLDALGTLVELLAPAPLLVGQLRRRGIACSERQAGAALREEIAFYRAHHDSAADLVSLELLRERCTEVLRDALAGAGVDAAVTAPHELLRAALLAALRFRAYPEVPAALRALRAAGHRLVVVSNWDVSLHDALRTTGLTGFVDGAISSAEAGAAKPDPRIFARALALAGGDAGGDAGGGCSSTFDDGAKAAVHVGDSLEHDVAGALAAGMRAVLVVRAGAPPAVPEGVAVIGSLTQLAPLTCCEP
ncbi:MAG: putative hydrolase of the superfamily [Solirubrobacteraceae bacterium]|jgi:putative hydrolase of the HAD superfamily|nr:putative hydrolase of the superfamily [Solirubrobacteraceae bacterium]